MTMNKIYSFNQIFQLLKDKGIIYDNSSFIKINEGMVHDVYKIKNGNNIYYLKIRLDYFKTDKKIKINPFDINHEKKSIALIDRYCKLGLVPRIVYSKDNFLLLENIVRKKSDLVFEMLYHQKFSISDARQLGIQMVCFHKCLSKIKNQLRSKEKDLEMYRNYLYWRFGVWKNKNINKVVSELKKCKRQYIYGDFNPKNVVFFGGKLKIFDLETVHQGNALFDVGFFAGHVFLSFFNKSNKRTKLIKEFFEGYELEDGDLQLALKITLATLYYRLKSSYSYETNFYLNKKSILRKVNNLLTHNENIKISDLNCL